VYSVPSRLIGEFVRIRIYDEKVEIYHNTKKQFEYKRILGRQAYIDYRHMIWSLVKKPGAFARYRYREEMFPTVIFRQAYDRIHRYHKGLKGDLEYLRILHLAASTMEYKVEECLKTLLESKKRFGYSEILSSFPREQIDIPSLQIQSADLKCYDQLLKEVGT
jgi:hypothetical protein